ncbi:Hsp20/alpha crystallin family protein [Roseimicrobium sp. ORNL1]|uniref:Hsp20/alpha crystallin family protein n=1 Tax=Roseimicrobium sp. ORNL1 TaxID=2711231 RepID=UPI0013E124EB|nr:Hsp20/alpha crystallin family protein [Roseimicrobium sp. ORNL1]QIF02848.1 Hsp20/alpha crystallin family protein [Roseimicrobium sp. ORNL1]
MRWNPIREIESLQNRVFNALAPSISNGTSESEGQPWAPLVDIVEDASEYIITTELPQIPKEDVKITLENGRLTVSGERKPNEDKKGRKIYRLERPYGTFFRTFALPNDAEHTKVNAVFRDGVLQITVPKHEKALPRQIEVKVD